MSATECDGPPRSILFVCNRNAVRSPMAHALADRRFRRRTFVDSVGLEPGSLDPFSVAVMKEIGIDISEHMPRSLSDIELADFEHVIALTVAARDRIAKLSPAMECAVSTWEIGDPSAAEGSRQARLDVYRSVRDELKGRIDRFADCWR